MARFFNHFVILVTVMAATNLVAASKKGSKRATSSNSTGTMAAASERGGNTRSDAVSAPTSSATEGRVLDSAVSGSTSSATVNVATDSMITGTVDLRPSWGSKRGEVHTENWVDLGYRKGNLHLVYEQDFYTNIYSPGSASEGMNLTLWDGFFRAKVADVWVSPSKTYSLSYELRPFVPTRATERDKGMITVVRNYAKFAAKVSDNVTLSLWEVPVIHFYNRAGNDIAGVASANRAFENRVYLMADWAIAEKWSVNIPLWLTSSKFREFGGAASSGKWEQAIWFYPELDYAFSKNYTLGLSWYNDVSFVNSTMSDVDFSTAFESGITQVVFRATL